MGIEETLQSLEKQLTGADDDEKVKEARMAVIKSAAENMDEDEKKDARALFAGDDDDDKFKKDAAEDDDEKKEAAEEDEDEDKMAKGKKGKKAMEDENKDMKQKVASLTAKINFLESKPIITEMLKAREDRGMSEKQINAFKNSLVGKTMEQIQQRYNEDKVLFGQSLVAAMPTDFSSELPFNAGLAASTKEVSMEDMFT